jgi:hypothetical protein
LADPNFIPPALRYDANTAANASMNQIPPSLRGDPDTIERESRNFIPESLRTEADKRMAMDRIAAIEQGAQPKPRQMGLSSAPMTNEERIAGFKAALEGKTPTTKPSESAPAVAPAVAPAPAGIKPAAPAAAPAPSGIKVAAPGQGNINPAPSDKIMPTAGIKIPGLEEPAADPYSKMSIEEIAAKKLAFLGPDVRKEERAGLMAERASAKDEARRAQSLRMAEFFAAWGSTPGSTINAGLTALKAKLPDIITDSREEAKIRRAINKDIAALDRADRLEKSGAWDEAAKIKQDQSKNAYNVWGKKIDFASARMSDASRIEAAKIGAESRVEAAGSRANSGGFKTVQDAENALDKHLTEGNKIGSQYSTDKAIVKARKADYEAGKLDPDKKRTYEDSLANVTKFQNREKELRDNVEFFKKNKGMTTTSSGSSSGSSGVDLNSFWSQK